MRTQQCRDIVAEIKTVTVAPRVPALTLSFFLFKDFYLMKEPPEKWTALTRCAALSMRGQHFRKTVVSRCYRLFHLSNESWIGSHFWDLQIFSGRTRDDTTTTHKRDRIFFMAGVGPLRSTLTRQMIEIYIYIYFFQYRTMDGNKRMGGCSEISGQSGRLYTLLLNVWRLRSWDHPPVPYPVIF